MRLLADLWARDGGALVSDVGDGDDVGDDASVFSSSSVNMTGVAIPEAVEGGCDSAVEGASDTTPIASGGCCAQGILSGKSDDALKDCAGPIAGMREFPFHFICLLFLRGTFAPDPEQQYVFSMMVWKIQNTHMLVWGQTPSSIETYT